MMPKNLTLWYAFGFNNSLSLSISLSLRVCCRALRREMELLQPSHPPHHGLGTNTLYGFPSSGSNFGYGFHPEMSSQPPQLPYILEGAGDHEEEEARDHEKVHVAVGKSMERAVALLQWSCKHFRDQEICVLHVHQPSHQIPTLRKFLWLASPLFFVNGSLNFVLDFQIFDWKSCGCVWFMF